MILSFRDKTTEAVFNGEAPKGFPADLVPVARRKLRYVHAAGDLRDLRAPPGNRLEALVGDRKGQYSIRVNQQFRVCFLWTSQGPVDVEIVDYHKEDAAMAKSPKPKALAPMHSGEVLREEFLVPLKLSAGALARACDLPRTRIERIASEMTGVSADTALRLSKALGTTAELWLNLQNDYDLQIAKRDIGAGLDRIETVNKPQAA